MGSKSIFDLSGESLPKSDVRSGVSFAGGRTLPIRDPKAIQK